MLILTIENIINEFQEKVKGITSELSGYLLEGRLYEFEEDLHKEITELYVKLATAFIMEASVSEELEEKARIIAQKKGLGEVRQETVKLQLRTGHEIKISSWFGVKSKSKRKKKRGPNGSGCHLLLYYWGCIKKATPSYYSLVAQLSVLCPSFEAVVRVLEHQQIIAAYKRVRDIAYAVGSKCMEDRIKVSLKSGENLVGKRVIISVDGGRTRLREENPEKEEKEKDKKNKGKRTPFDTPWREPKLFVIHVLDEEGNISKAELPVYDLVMGDQKAKEFFELLSQYLQELQIQDASEVLFISDGAKWIWKQWKQVRKTLVSLGIPEEIIYEAIDFYHAVQHLSELCRTIYPNSWKQKQREKLFRSLKKSLKNGKIHRIIAKAKSLARDHYRPHNVLKALEYFQNHEHRMQYGVLKDRKLPCGSGIIESAVRRIVNLRFKSPSTFWKRENVEKLIFLRGLFLANRWAYAMKFLAKKNYLSIPNIERLAA